jgi:hypothetical protein
MGCNVPDVMYTILCFLTASASILAQRWGCAARNRAIQGTCILLVPWWAFRPNPVETESSGLSHPNKAETKADTEWHKKLDNAVEAFVNAGMPTCTNGDWTLTLSGCWHAYLRT